MLKTVVLGNRGSLLDEFLSEIRSEKIQTDRMRFRKNMERVGEIMAYEISREMVFRNESIKTPLGIADVPVLDNQPVLATILRAGIPFHQGFLNYFDRADNAFVAGFRKYHDDNSFEIKIDYVTSPDLTNREVIIIDPMLATGGSFELAYKALTKFGKPAHIHLAAIISSQEGIENMHRIMPSERCTIWSAAVDDELTVKSYIVPGLGDAGDLSYGDKLSQKDE
ncbi:MAG: uracil phosphoribosyltransferase [Bacteroidales bacterium]|nr:uracil phosphoribosyltransferase [Bacteroidales bacterium]